MVIITKVFLTLMIIFCVSIIVLKSSRKAEMEVVCTWFVIFSGGGALLCLLIAIWMN